MFEQFKPLNRSLGMLLKEVERAHGTQSLIFNSEENAVRDFPTQRTIWAAYEGRKPF
ncbi:MULTISPECIES: hypothetical protein [Corallococcus]|uniref:hypothetical protein n=1 Tax=Corallococcus TaxID=83461 RepID=UPI00131594DD|nr:MULTISPECIES: hypothetical protein [Corallococcus]